jgi:hypothetical protein
MSEVEVQLNRNAAKRAVRIAFLDEVAAALIIVSTLAHAFMAYASWN